jgi:hypothetical protein
MKDWLDGEYTELENEIGVLKAEIPLALWAFDKPYSLRQRFVQKTASYFGRILTV